MLTLLVSSALRTASRAWFIAALLVAAASHAGEIVLASVGPYSGPLADNGEGNFIGAKAYIDAVNARGGVNGNKIRLIREDDQYKAEETLRLVKLVAARDKPMAFLNLVGSPNVSLLLKEKTFETLGIPAIGITPGSAILTNPGSKYIFHVQAGDESQLERLLEQQRTVGVQRVAVVYQDIPFGRAGLRYLEEHAGPKGIRVVAKAAMAVGQVDARQIARQVKVGNPQTYILVLSPYSAAAFVRDARAAGDGTPIFTMSYTPAGVLVKTAGMVAATGVGLSQITPNPSSTATGLVREYQAVLAAHAPAGTPYSSFSLIGFIAAKVAVEGLKRTGASPTPARLVGALGAIRDLDFGGYVVDFSAGTQVGSRYVTLGVIGRNGTLMY